MVNISDVTVHGYLVLVGGEVVLACQFQVVVASEHAYGLGVTTLVHQSGNLTLPQSIELLVDGHQAAAQLVQSSPADITHVHIQSRYMYIVYRGLFNLNKFIITNGPKILIFKQKDCYGIKCF